MRPSGADGEVNQLFSADISFQSAIRSDGGVAPYGQNYSLFIIHYSLERSDIKIGELGLDSIAGVCRVRKRKRDSAWA